MGYIFKVQGEEKQKSPKKLNPLLKRKLKSEKIPQSRKRQKNWRC